MTRAPLVLIASEHEWASRSLESILAPRGYAVLRAYTGRQALERASGSNADGVFIDRNLPDMSGAELCAELLERQVVSRSAPLIIVTAGASSREERLEAMRAGAWDVVAQPVDAEELLLRMERFVRAKLDADQAAEDALIDAATGLYSWEGIARRVREIAAGAERFGRPLACVVCALEPEGEGEGLEDGAFISEAVERLRQLTRRSDVIGRIGPREFAIIAPDTPEAGARVLADRLRAWTGASADGDGDGNGGGEAGAEDGHRVGDGTKPRRRTRARAGVSAAADLKAYGLDPLELLVQATLASRKESDDTVH